MSVAGQQQAELLEDAEQSVTTFCIFPRQFAPLEVHED